MHTSCGVVLAWDASNSLPFGFIRLGTTARCDTVVELNYWSVANAGSSEIVDNVVELNCWLLPNAASSEIASKELSKFFVQIYIILDLEFQKWYKKAMNEQDHASQVRSAKKLV